MFLVLQKCAFLILGFVLALDCAGQHRYRDILHPGDKELVFPVFISGTKAVAKKINDLLQMDFFGTTTATNPGSKLFDDSRFIAGDTISQTGYTAISYKIELNNKRILSVLFEVEAMGAYPTYFKRYFSFNSGDGRLISADTLFTKEGIDWIRKTLVDKRSKEIKQWIGELKEDDNAMYNEDSSFIADNFAKCNAEAHENSMFIGKSKILFYKEDCFPHAWGPYETSLDIEFTQKELEKHLSDYGKKMLFTK